MTLSILTVVSIFSSISALTNRFFFFNDTATTEIYTLSLHDALPIYLAQDPLCQRSRRHCRRGAARVQMGCGRCHGDNVRSEEHTSELQSRSDLVCRLLLEKKKKEMYQETAISSTILRHSKILKAVRN